MNISRLLTRTKSKTKFIFDLCTPNTLFLCFCETFLTDEISDSELMIPDFTITRCDRRQRMGGGVCMYVKNSVNFTTCVSYSNSTCELLIVRLHDPSLIIVLIYRPPSCSTENFDDIINQVYQFTYSLATPLPNIIMLGDFNLPDVNWAAPNINCHNVDKLTDLADHLFINQQVEHPTRKSNILDLIFSPDEFIRSIHITETFISDHSILLAETNIPISLSNSTVFNPPESEFSKLDFNKADWANLRADISSLSFVDVYSSMNAIDVNVSKVIETIGHCCMLHVPLKSFKSSKVTHFHRERKILMRKRRKLMKKTIHDSKISETLISIDKKICASHQDEKLHDEQVAVAKIKDDPHFFFRYAKKSSICRSNIGPLLDPSTNCVTDDKFLMCKLLVDQFNSVFTIPDQSKIVIDPEVFFSVDEESAIESPHLSNIVFTDEIVLLAIKELSHNSAAGPDGIPASLLINCAAELAPILCDLFKHTFSEGFIPPSFKRAAIVPVFKAGDKAKPSNYRPISLTSTICKILERIIRKQVFTYLSDNKLFNETQHGFRGGRSCLSALLDVFDNIMNMLGKDPSVDMVYLDFAKAFDKVDHGILLHKLKDLGITGKLGVWFFHFLSNRSHFVRLPGGVSNDHPVISGVPQGTVLGPLLFLITISDINKDISSSKLISFADDTRIYSKIADVSDCDNLQYDLNMIYDWAITNNMFFNAQKFHYVSFNTDPTGNKCNVYVNPKMDIIPHSSNVQDLGITMSSDCTFNVHINSLSKRCKNLTGWILRTFISRDKLTMLTLFKALVLSRLDYGSQLWSPHKICQINQIEKIQRAFTKHITGMYDLPYTKRLKMLNLNSLHRRRERYCIIYLWKILEGLVPNFSDPIVCSFSDRRGRSCIVSHVNPGRQGTLAFNSFRWRSVRIFNRLPIHIRNISACSIDRFKSQLDRYLRTIPDLPSQPGYNNSLDGGDGIQRWTLRDGLAAE